MAQTQGMHYPWGVARALPNELELPTVARGGGPEAPVADAAALPDLVGDGPEMRALFTTLRLAAPSSATALVTGESGTGKELVARALHDLSPRHAGPFVAVSCAALSASLLESELFGHERGAFTGATERRPGRFEVADGGTLFLDEVGEIPMPVQVKLLRVLQERRFERVGGTDTIKVDVRIVAATNRDLGVMVEAGSFREDLYYRLNVLHLALPPLRRRRGDIARLWHHFVERHAALEGRSPPETAPEALADVLAYDWPGNVRELENAAHHAVVLTGGSRIERSALPQPVTGEGRPRDVREVRLPGMTLAELERAAILVTYETLERNARRTAAALGISERKVRYRLKAYREAGHLDGE